jgi:hypothetical protein
MDRRAFMTTVAFGAVATPAIADAQGAKKARRAGFLSVGSRE